MYNHGKMEYGCVSVGAVVIGHRFYLERSPVCMERHFHTVERCPCKEALHENTGNNCRTSSHVTIILIELHLSPSGATSQ